MEQGSRLLHPPPSSATGARLWTGPPPLSSDGSTLHRYFGLSDPARPYILRVYFHDRVIQPLT